MNDKEATLMMGSGVIESATIFRSAAGDGWRVYLYGADLPSGAKNVVELARLGDRTWASLDTAYVWLMQRFNGRHIRIEVDSVDAVDAADAVKAPPERKNSG